jgi:hypothetical protein
MRRWVGLAVLAILGAVAAGCTGGGGHHATLSASEALAQARKDGFVRPRRDSAPASWYCEARYSDQGPPTPTGRYANYVRPSYALGFNDRRVPAGPENTARIGMLVIVFPTAAIASRCAAAGVYQAMHIPVDPDDATGHFELRPYKLIDATTVETYMHARGAPGFEFPDDTGSYETYFARRRVFALGIAYNEPHSTIVREDLERLAAEIAG